MSVTTIQPIPKQYVCIHPGASVAEKRWPLENFAVVADAIASRGFQVLLTGTASETNLTQALAEIMSYKPINLAGKTSLGAMAALLSQASLLVCNDTGVSHLAAALKVKSVVIFTNSSLHRWAPLNHKIHRSLSSQVLTSLLPVTPEMVMEQVEDLLAKEVSHVS